MPLYYLEENLKEIKQELFKENYTHAQVYILDCLGIDTPSTNDIQHIATCVLQMCTITPFLTTKLKQMTQQRENERLNTIAQESLFWE